MIEKDETHSFVTLCVGGNDTPASVRDAQLLTEMDELNRPPINLSE